MQKLLKYIRCISDIHLEFAPFDLPKMETDEETLLILAGDIQVGIKNVDWFLTLKRFPKIIYVIGNHEHYRQEFTTTERRIKEQLSVLGITNVEVCGEMPRQLIYENIRIIAGTLWTDANNEDEMSKVLISQYLNEYRIVQNSGSILSIQDTINIFRRSVERIEYYLNQDFDGKTIVVTHHLPSLEAVAERFKGKDNYHLNGGFASDLDWLIKKYQPAMWLFGHTHDCVSMNIGVTHLLCNPRGYPAPMRTLEDLDNRPFENRLFYPLLRVTI